MQGASIITTSWSINLNINFDTTTGIVTASLIDPSKPGEGRGTIGSTHYWDIELGHNEVRAATHWPDGYCFLIAHGATTTSTTWQHLKSVDPPVKDQTYHINVVLNTGTGVVTATPNLAAPHFEFGHWTKTGRAYHYFVDVD